MREDAMPTITANQLLAEFAQQKKTPISRQVEIVDQLIRKYKLTREEIEERSGVSKSTITLRKKMREFEPEILDHFDHKRLPLVRGAIVALLEIPDHTRMELVPYLIERGEATSSKIVHYTKPHRSKNDKKGKASSPQAILSSNSTNKPTQTGLKIINAALQQTCDWCGAKNSPPAVRDATCKVCPLVVFVNLIQPNSHQPKGQTNQ